MWKEVALLLIGFALGSYAGFSIQALLFRPLVGDDFEINKPKVKGENNLLQVLQTNTKDSTGNTGTSETTKEKKIKIFKRKNK